ncbi:hypothetical protein D3C81_2142270 [compost metagenome]
MPNHLEYLCGPLYYGLHCAIVHATTNPHDRRGLTIWLEGGKPALAGFFVSGVREMQGTPELEALRTRIYING